MDEPSLVLLQSATKQHKLSVYHLTRLINGHQNLFNSSHRLNSLQDLADWSGASQASILYLLLQATYNQKLNTNSPIPHSSPFQHTGHEHSGTDQAGPASPLTPLDFDHAASHLAVSLAIEDLIARIPLHAQHRINLIPTEIGARYGLTDEALFRQGPNAEGLGESVANLVAIGQNELSTSRECLSRANQSIPKDRIPVFLGGTVASSVFEQLSSPKINFNPFEYQKVKRNWKLPFKLALNNYKLEY